jgi:hypothetical protein
MDMSKWRYAREIFGAFVDDHLLIRKCRVKMDSATCTPCTKQMVPFQKKVPIQHDLLMENMKPAWGL